MHSPTPERTENDVILLRLIGVMRQLFMLDFPVVDGLLLQCFPAIVVNCSASFNFEARNV